MAPPVWVEAADEAELEAEPETAAALAVAELETDAAAEPEAEEPVAARRVAQRDLANVWMFWRSSAEQSEFWRRQVVPAARKALEPVVQRQTGSVASQPEAPTADWMQGNCEQVRLMDSILVMFQNLRRKWGHRQ